jgi:exopolysaccharide production protein ExoZ
MRPNKINSIQGLRAIAASLVVLLHVLRMADLFSPESSIFNNFFHFRHFGASGVDIFFVISGFIMTVVSKSKYGLPGASVNFFKRRLIRIVPLYWFYSSLMVLLIFLPFALQKSVFDLTFTIRSYLFIPSLNPTSQEMTPLVAQGWTLFYEMYFYILFAVFLLFKQKWFLPSISIFFSICIYLGFITDIGPNSSYRLFTNPILIEFLMGCFIGTAYISLPRLGVLSSAVLIGIGCLGLLATILFGKSGYTRVVDWGMPAACLVAGVVNLENAKSFKTPHILVMLGDSSYSLYLYHTFALMVIGKLMKMGLLSRIPIDFLIILSVLFCMITGHIAYLCIEKPITKYFSKSKNTSSYERQAAISL